MQTEELWSAALNGDQRALAKLASILERRIDPDFTEFRRAISLASKQAHIVGMTGPPGAGKSSLLSAILTHVSSAGRTIAVLAVDPTSPISGGATLGDRIRMSEASLLPGVFVRSVAARHHVDGLAAVIPDMIRLFSAAGYDYVVVETVGAGQNQFLIADYVHTLVLVEAPGAGDSVQMLKAGVMELADIYAVTKGDLPGAHRVSREIKGILGLAMSSDNWPHPVVVTSSETGDGVGELVQEIDNHMNWLSASGEFASKELAMARGAIRAAVGSRLEAFLASSGFDQIVESVSSEQLTADEAAAIMLRQIAGLD